MNNNFKTTEHNKLIFFKWNLKVNGRENLDFYLEYIMLKIRCGNLKYVVLKKNYHTLLSVISHLT
jgi:hypothetical protein